MTELYDKCETLLSDIDSDLVDGGETERTAITLLASEVCGTDEAELSKLLGIDESHIRAMGKRFRESGVWDAEGVATRDWQAPEDGGLAFTMDVLIGKGTLSKTWDSAAGEWKYTLTDAGKTYVEDRLLK